MTSEPRMQVEQEDWIEAEKFRRGHGGKYDRDVATLAAAFARHRLRAVEGVAVAALSAATPSQRDAEVERLREALTLAANRLARCSVEFDTGTRQFIEYGDWAEETRQALQPAPTKENDDG
jgi:hypothetical protein